jgi:NAD(P)H-binding
MIRKAIPTYMHWKYEADKNLVKRTTFKWIILRPGGLSNNPGEGKVNAGRTHLGKMISVRTFCP